MAYRMSYTLIKRGKYWQVRFYDADGVRRQRTTHETAKGRARLVCDEWLINGELCTRSFKTFGSYAKGFYNEDSDFYKERQITGRSCTKSTLRVRRNCFESEVFPYWKEFTFDKINPVEIRKWRNELLSKNLGISYINAILVTFKIVINNALKEGIVKKDPFFGVELLKHESKKKSAFSVEEIQKILEVTQGPRIKLIFLTAAITGMRISEILAIRKDVVKKNYILVNGQFNSKEGLVPTKTRKNRIVPIPERFSQLLKQNITDDNFLFCQTYLMYSKKLENAKNSSGIIKTGLTFHSFRHFFNTYLLAENISSAKTAAVIGHSNKDVAMQDIYTNFDISHFSDVICVQDKLLDRLLEFY